MDEAFLTPLDESFGHQLVAPRAIKVHDDPRWAERAYYLLHVAPDLTLNVGRQLYPHQRRWWTFASAATGERQICLRDEQHYELADDPDTVAVGPLRLEVERPLEKIKLQLADPEAGLSYDLTYEARFPAVLSDATRVEQEGRLVTDTISFFQSGNFTGTVEVEGRTYEVDGLPGFRDRSWGVRKHDGSPRRGFVIFCGCELPGRSIYLLLLENARAKRVFTNGWVVDETGVADRLVEAEHELEFDDGGELQRGSLELTLKSGAAERVEIEVENRLYLPGVGYSPDPEFTRPGRFSFDLTDPAVRRSLFGQIDNGARFTCAGETGSGYVETGLGVHARYLPEGLPEAD